MEPDETIDAANRLLEATSNITTAEDDEEIAEILKVVHEAEALVNTTATVHDKDDDDGKAPNKVTNSAKQ